MKKKFRLKWNGLKITNDITDALDKASEAMATEIADKARALCPVETGRLKNSIRSYRGQKNPRSFIVEVGDAESVPYASYVELGRSDQEARPFFRTAANKQKRKGRKKYVEALQEKL